MADGFHGRGRGQATRAFGAVFCSIVASAACSSSNQNPAQSPEAQSTAEYDLARDAYKNEKLRDVLAHVQKSLEHDDSNADAAFLGASVYLRFCAADESSPDCRWEEAEKYARMAVEANPELRDAKNMLGVILVHRGKYDEAVNVLKPLANDILYNFPENAWGNLGWAYLLQGNADSAIDALRRSVAAQPLFCVGSYRLGLAYEKKGDLGAARDAFTKAVETPAPDCQRLQDAFDARARVGIQLGLRSEARADLTKCVDIGNATPVGKKCAEQLKTLQ
ncbi:MAG: tetratricopeptide repeat protein [Polyangiaceae bacterium]